MLRGLFINNFKAKDSIYESGLMVYNCIKDSYTFSIDYKEVDADHREIDFGYDFYFFNYHPTTMGWLDTKNLKRDLGFVMTMILEVSPNDIFVLCPSTHFDLYCVIDPSFESTMNNVISFSRPLEKVNYTFNNVQHEIPVIGTFGFATKGKGFQHVVDAINCEFDRAILKINIPFGDFVPESEKYAKYLAEICKSRAKVGIQVDVTHDYMTKEELIKWCGNNTLNCFLYDRNMPGLSATTDQAIVSERPLSVSNNPTFRHITKYLPSYPDFKLKDSIEKSIPIVRKMKEAWSSENFKKKFEEVVIDFEGKFRKVSCLSKYQLPIKSRNIFYLFSSRIRKYSKYIWNFNFLQILNSFKSNEVI